MKCPNCSFNNIASAEECKICGTKLEVIEGANNDTLALDEALKAIFAGKIKNDEIVTESFIDHEEEEEVWESAWEPMNDDIAGGDTIPRYRRTKASEEDEESPKQDEGSEDQDKNLFINPLIDFPDEESVEEEEPDYSSQKIPVYERTDNRISIDQEAESLLPLMDRDVSSGNYPPKQKRNKMDEIAAIGLVILVVCLIALIYFAVKMSRETELPTPVIVSETHSNISTAPSLPKNSQKRTENQTSPQNTQSQISEEESSSSSDIKETSIETTAMSEETSSVTTTEAPPFDESYFTKSGTLSGGNATESDILRKVRMGDHHYFHRFVFDFSGNSVPVYQVNILEEGMLVEVRVENISDFTKEFGLTEWNYLAESISISSDAANAMIVHIKMTEPVMISTYGIEEPASIVLDVRGDSCKD